MKNLKSFLLLASVFIFFVNADQIDRIIAKVGSEVITSRDVESAIEKRKALLNEKHKPAEANQLLQKYKQNILQEMILQKILEAEIEKENISVGSSQVEVEYQGRLQRLGMSESDLIKKLKGTSIKTYKEGIKEQLKKNEFIKKKISPYVSISEIDLQNEYEKHKHLFKTFNKFRFIEVIISPDAMPNKTELEKLVKNIHTKLSKNQPVSDLIKKYSVGAFAKNGGDSGLTEASNLNPQIVQVLSSLKKGQTSKILTTQQGIFIFKLLDKADPKPLPYSEVSYQVRNMYAEKEVEKQLKKYLMRIKDQTYVEIKK